MLKRTWAILCFPTAIFALIAHAQTPAQPHQQIGDTTLTESRFVITTLAQGGIVWTLSGGAHVQSPTYALIADHAVITTRSKYPVGRSPIARVDAYGGAATGAQVVGHLLDKNDPQRLYTIYADHAVYTPDDSRVQGGTIDLTGHPKVIMHDPKNLAAGTDAVTVAPHIVIDLGPATGDYPKVSGENGTTTFTPLQQ